MEFNCILRSNGSLHIHNRKDFDKWLILQAREKELPFTITVERKRAKRSGGVNRYWWGVVIFVVHRGLKELGHDMTKEEVHEFIKTNFNFEEIVNEETGQVLRIPKSTSEMPGSDFWDLIERVARWAAEYLGETIPMPNEQGEIDFNR